MTKTKITTFQKVVIAIFVAMTLFVSYRAWEVSHRSMVRALVEIEEQSVYGVALSDGDTLWFNYFSLPIRQVPSQKYNTFVPIDTIVGEWKFDICRDSATLVEKNPGVCISASGTAQTRCSTSRDIWSSSEVKELLRKELPRMELLAKNYSAQSSEIAYYLKTHSAVDAGYNDVVRYKESIETKAHNISSSVLLMKKILTTDSEAVKFCRFYINGSPCKVISKSNGVAKVRRINGKTELSFEWKNLLTNATYQDLLWSDTLGNRYSLIQHDSIYFGNRYSPDGSFYRGELCKDFKREGMGLTIDESFIKYGKWNSDKFKGEQMLYTADRIYGIDISRYQHDLPKPIMTTTKVKTKNGKVKAVRKKITTVPIDWDALRITRLGKDDHRLAQGTVDYPVSFVFIKVTQGTTITSKYYASDLASARRHSIPVAPYHFFSTKESGAAQARHFVNNARLGSATLPPMLDVEPSDAQIRAMGGAQALFMEMLSWLHVVEKNSHRAPILYISQSFVNKYMKEAPEELLKYDVWIARYGEYRPYVKLVLWQLSPYGRVTGIHGDVDINVFNGHKDDFDAWVNQ